MVRESAAILRMTLCDGLRVVSMDERAIHQTEYYLSQSMSTLFFINVPLLKPTTDFPFRLVESVPS
jgi:hypothetical protein